MSSSSTSSAARATRLPSASNTMLPPSNTSSSCPHTWFTYASAQLASAARVANMRSRACDLPAWNGEPLMLMLSSAPPAACCASGPVGLHTSSQMLMPTFTPPISYSSYGSLASPAVK